MRMRNAGRCFVPGHHVLDEGLCHTPAVLVQLLHELHELLGAHCATACWGLQEGHVGYRQQNSGTATI
jgi:hypothetical protein